MGSCEYESDTSKHELIACIQLVQLQLIRFNAIEWSPQQPFAFDGGTHRSFARSSSAQVHRNADQLTACYIIHTYNIYVPTHCRYPVRYSEGIRLIEHIRIVFPCRHSVYKDRVAYKNRANTHKSTHTYSQLFVACQQKE